VSSRRVWGRALRWRVAIALGALVIGCVALWLAWPVPAEIARAEAQGVTIVDRHGQPLRSTRAGDGTNATWVPYDRIDPDVLTAFVAVEDRRFWDHAGVDPRAVGRATLQLVRE